MAFPPPTPLAPAPPARGRLGGGYRWLLGVGWLVLLTATAVLGRSTVRMGDPTRWTDWWFLAAVPPVAVVVVVVLDRPFPLVLSALASGELLVLGLLDLGDGRRYVGATELALGVSALVLTLAATAGRRERSKPVTPRG